MGTPQTVEVANLGMADSLILMVMALVVFGPRRLPQIGRQIGKLMYEFRKASNDFKYQMEEELRSAEEADRRKKEEERQSELARTIGATSGSTLAAESVTGSQGPDGPGSPGPEQPESSQGPESSAGAPSPYPGEDAYPEMAASQAGAAEPAQSPLGADQRPIRVQPPTVGEQVPAARPWNLEEKLAELNIPGPEPVADDELVKPKKEDNPAVSGTSGSVTEQAAHHG